MNILLLHDGIVSKQKRNKKPQTGKPAAVKSAILNPTYL